MTREQVIEHGKEQLEVFGGEHLEQDSTTKNYLVVDCISRAQAQTEIEINASRYTIAKERGGMGQVEWSDQLIKVSDAVDIIRHLPSVTPQEPRWIHVIDKLPEVHKEPYYADDTEMLYESDHVLTCCKSGKEYVFAIGTVIYDEVCGSYEWSGLYDYSECVIDDMSVIAWMPLPEFFIEEQQGEQA